MTGVAFQRILVLSPHTDDAELGCGGTIARMAEAGASVHVVAFSAAEASLAPHLPSDTLVREFHEAVPRLGVPAAHLRLHRYPVRCLDASRQEILEELVALRREIEPDCVLLPSRNDIHQDHQVIATEGLRAFKSTSILGYELPWNLRSFSPNAFVRLERRHVEAKWHALQAYASQIALARPYFNEDFLTGLARMRGVQGQMAFAEAFEVVNVNF